jgi:hypothetical protein
MLGGKNGSLPLLAEKFNNKHAFLFAGIKPADYRLQYGRCTKTNK